MENYRKGKNEEELLIKEKIPISELSDNFLWMQVRGGSKIRNLLDHALNTFPNSKTVVWTGFGPSIGKTITCAEIMKREYNHTLHQITKLGYKMVEEYWDPLSPELDQLVVKRKLPMIHICLSLEPLNTNESGYQAPGEVIPYKGQNKHHLQKRRNDNKSSRNRDNGNNTHGSSFKRNVNISKKE